MKKTAIALALLIAVVACKQNEGAPDGGAQVTTGTGTADTVSYLSPDEYLIVHIKAERASKEMAFAVGEWLDETLGGYYPGDVRDLQQMVDFYGQAMSDTLSEWAKEIGPYTYLEYDAKMEKAWENDLVVTYTLETFQNMGGAHPLSGCEGVTFRKSDGRRLDWNIVSRRSNDQMKDQLRNGLKNYLEISTDDELLEILGDDKYYCLPYPQTPPYMLENGLVFIYQQYELMAYAMGMGTDTLDYETIKPLLTCWAANLLE